MRQTFLIAVHGGPFLAEKKDADAPAKQLAQSCYTTASVNERLRPLQKSFGKKRTRLFELLSRAC